MTGSVTAIEGSDVRIQDAGNGCQLRPLLPVSAVEELSGRLQRLDGPEDGVGSTGPATRDPPRPPDPARGRGPAPAPRTLRGFSELAHRWGAFVAFDFGSLASTASIGAITDPVILFDALPNKANGYGYLRAVQKTVLDAWSPRRDERDVVVKTNTGGGKTVIGLLMLQCSLHEGKGPALYLAPEPHLADRVREEADRLGLTVVSDPEATKFISGDAICVTTMKTLVNGSPASDWPAR